MKTEKPLYEKRELMGEDDMNKLYYLYREEDVKEAVEKLKEELYGKFNGYMPDDNLELWGIIERKINKIFGDLK